MSVQPGRQDDPESLAADPPSHPASSFAPASGVVRRDELEAEIFGGAPPWTVVYAYLIHGEHRAWIEAHASRSRAFGEVLAALRNDLEERRAARGLLLPFRRRAPK